MRIVSATIKSTAGIALAKISVKHNQNKIKGVYNNNQMSVQKKRRRRHKFNFKREFNAYVDTNYGDVLSKSDKQKLKEEVQSHYDDGCITDVKSLQQHIEKIGRQNDLIFGDE